jgi:hypothetical protein
VNTPPKEPKTWKGVVVILGVAFIGFLGFKGFRNNTREYKTEGPASPIVEKNSGTLQSGTSNISQTGSNNFLNTGSSNLIIIGNSNQVTITNHTAPEVLAEAAEQKRFREQMSEEFMSIERRFAEDLKAFFPGAYAFVGLKNGKLVIEGNPRLRDAGFIVDWASARFGAPEGSSHLPISSNRLVVTLPSFQYRGITCEENSTEVGNALFASTKVRIPLLGIGYFLRVYKPAPEPIVAIGIAFWVPGDRGV